MAKSSGLSPWVFSTQLAPPLNILNLRSRGSVFGSVVQQTERVSSDVDSMVPGNVDFTEMVSALSLLGKPRTSPANKPFPFAGSSQNSRQGNHLLHKSKKKAKEALLGSRIVGRLRGHSPEKDALMAWPDMTGRCAQSVVLEPESSGSRNGGSRLFHRCRNRPTSPVTCIAAA
jgi:hypothetical protein